MKFSEDSKNGQIDTYQPTWEQIDKSMDHLNGTQISYFILTADNGDYIQCAGSPERLTIEIRSIIGSDFKHYRLGIGEIKSPMKTVWTRIECKVGSISVHTDEVLSLENAKSAFKAFFENQPVPAKFRKRNITRQIRS